MKAWNADEARELCGRIAWRGPHCQAEYLVPEMLTRIDDLDELLDWLMAQKLPALVLARVVGMRDAGVMP